MHERDFKTPYTTFSDFFDFGFAGGELDYFDIQLIEMCDLIGVPNGARALVVDFRSVSTISALLKR
ncbi:MULTISPECIES: hypothetical protein [unclassified Pantoea]|uniref:hypothetical protein n=1 Tax=unclassified Pantoea TaxID=2630326 RepID=UPI000535331C|nr:MULTISPECIES: hypothetical protein [unclassified Pantoea]MDU6389560.1 hypothetical protein [Pantoea sp.]